MFGMKRSAEALVFGSEHYSIGSSVLRDDAERLPLITAFEVIEHFQDAPRFLTEVNRVLAHKGMVRASAPNPDLATGDNPYHLHEVDRREMEDMVRGCGLRIRRVVGQAWQVRRRAFTAVPGLRRAIYEWKTRSHIRPRKLPYHADPELLVVRASAGA